MKVIITVLGRDREGIIATVSSLLYEQNANILDISQTILSGYFTMVMLVDVTKMNIPFAQMQNALTEKANDLGVEIRMQRSEIFDAMHRI